MPLNRDFSNRLINVWPEFNVISIGNSMISSDIWHNNHEWNFKTVIRNFTSL